MKNPFAWQPRAIIFGLLTGSASLAFTVIVLTFLNLNWETWLTEHGYQNSYRFAGPVMSWLASVGSSWPFAFFAGALIGGAITHWAHGKFGTVPEVTNRPNVVIHPGSVLTSQDTSGADFATDSQGFDYPYPKAVLQASIAQRNGTLEARQDGRRFKVTVAMQIKNAHHSDIVGWSAFVTTIHEGRHSHNVAKDLRIVKSKRTLPVGEIANIPLVYRDLSDEISRPPFLLRLADRDMPLEENREYMVEILLKSANPQDTSVIVFLVTGKDLDISAYIGHQAVG